MHISKGSYPVTLLPPPRRLVPRLGLGTTWVRQPRSGGCHHPTAATKCNERPSRATANPVDGKACSSTKGGLLRYIPNTYYIHKVSSLNFAYFQGKLSRYMIKMYRYEFFTVFDLISALVPKIAHPDRFRKTCAARLAHSSTGVYLTSNLHVKSHLNLTFINVSVEGRNGYTHFTRKQIHDLIFWCQF